MPSERKKLTKPEIDQYVRTGDGACPYCGSVEVERAQYEGERDAGSIDAHCLSIECGQEWREAYNHTLAGISQRDDDGCFYETGGAHDPVVQAEVERLKQRRSPTVPQCEEITARVQARAEARAQDHDDALACDPPAYVDADEAEAATADRKPLTPEIVREHVKHGQTCPFCDSHLISGGAFTGEAQSAWQLITCNACGAHWNDVFHIVGVDVIDDDGDIIDQIYPDQADVRVEKAKMDVVLAEMDQAGTWAEKRDYRLHERTRRWAQMLREATWES